MEDRAQAAPEPNGQSGPEPSRRGFVTQHDTMNSLEVYDFTERPTTAPTANSNPNSNPTVSGDVTLPELARAEDLFRPDSSIGGSHSRTPQKETM